MRRAIGLVVVIISSGFAVHAASPDPASLPQVLEPLKRNCLASDLNACRELGNAFADGQQVVQDYELANLFWTFSCHKGDARSCHNLGLAHVRGEGVPANCYAGMRYFERGCQGGYEKACIGYRSVAPICGGATREVKQAKHSHSAGSASEHEHDTHAHGDHAGSSASAERTVPASSSEPAANSCRSSGAACLNASDCCGSVCYLYTCNGHIYQNQPGSIPRPGASVDLLMLQMRLRLDKKR